MLTLLLGLVTVACLCACRYGPGLSRHILLLYYQHECMVYTMPKETVVVETVTAEAEKLLASGKGYRAFRTEDAQSSELYRPFCVAYLANPQLSRLSSKPDECVAFMHQRRSRAGHVRLVFVRAVCRPAGTVSYSVMIMQGHVVVPGSFTKSPSAVPLERSVLSDVWPAERDRDGLCDVEGSLRLYCGQPDCVDESHFTIAYRYKGLTYKDWRPGIIDGWLMDNDEVKLQIGNSDRLKNSVDPL